MFIALSLSMVFIPFVVGLTTRRFQPNDITPTDRIFLNMILGLCLMHIPVLLGISLSTALLLIATLSMLGILTLFLSIWSSGKNTINPGFLIKIAIPSFFIFLYWPVLLNEPITEVAWDSRSVWFFHGKMMFYEGRLSGQMGLTLPGIGWTHPYYPKLNASLAALLTTLMGRWNEWLPKLSLISLITPAIFGFSSFLSRNPASWILGILLFVSPPLNWWYTIGYMDAQTALYAGLALLYYGRFLNRKNDADLLLAFASAMFTLQLKNEGSLVCLCFGVVVFVFMKLKLLTWIKKQIPLLMILALPHFIWKIFCKKWGFNYVLGIKSPGRIWARIQNDHALSLVWNGMWNHPGLAWFSVFAITTLIWSLFLWKNRRSPLPQAVIPAFGFLALYFAGTYFVYVVSPYPLDWLVPTSADRTTLPILVSSMVACFWSAQRSFNPSTK